MIRLTPFAALAAFSALLPVGASAEDWSLWQLGAVPVQADRLTDGASVLAVAVTGELSGPAPHHGPASGRVTGLRRVVMIDGQLLSIDERFLRDQIAAGAMTVVFPGSTAPWREGALPPAYPPDWFLADGAPATGG